MLRARSGDISSPSDIEYNARNECYASNVYAKIFFSMKCSMEDIYSRPVMSPRSLMHILGVSVQAVSESSAWNGPDILCSV